MNPYKNDITLCIFLKSAGMSFALIGKNSHGIMNGAAREKRSLRQLKSNLSDILFITCPKRKGPSK